MEEWEKLYIRTSNRMISVHEQVRNDAAANGTSSKRAEVALSTSVQGGVCWHDLR